MTKHKKNSSLENQPSLFDIVLEVEKRNGGIPNGSLDIDQELRCCLSEDLKHAKDGNGRTISRYEVAAKMSELVGREITATMLNNWTAEAHEKHNFPSKWLPAFVQSTGGQRRAFECLSRHFECLSRHSGLFALPTKEALLSEIKQIEEEIRERQQDRRQRLMFIREYKNRG